MKIENFQPLLRSLNFDNNQIRKVQPLVNCGFLQELYLQNNLLSGEVLLHFGYLHAESRGLDCNSWILIDMTDLFAISLCQDLRLLDLRKNPISYDRCFKEAVLILFPSLQVCVSCRHHFFHFHSVTLPSAINQFSLFLGSKRRLDRSRP